LKDAADLVADEARRLVPVKSGALKRSITTTNPERSRLRSHANEVFIGFKPPISRRAHLTEFGTVHSAAKPFLRPALDGKAGQAIRDMGKDLRYWFDRNAGKG
jgi:HK97 gp10 family phage protein